MPVTGLNETQHLCRLNQLQAISHNNSCSLSCYYGNGTAAVHIIQIWYKSLPSRTKYAANHPAVRATISPIRTEKNSRNDQEKGTTWLTRMSSLAAKNPSRLNFLMTDLMLFKKLDHLSLLKTRRAWRGPEVRPGRRKKVKERKKERKGKTPPHFYISPQKG